MNALALKQFFLASGYKRRGDGVWRSFGAHNIVVDPARFPLGLPQYRPVLGTDLHELSDNFEYVTVAGRRIEIASGFRFDGASIPWFLWISVGHPMQTDYIVGAVVHDYLCDSCASAEERLFADRIFDEVNRQTGVGRVRRWVLFRGVRLGAWWRGTWGGWPGDGAGDVAFAG